MNRRIPLLFSVLLASCASVQMESQTQVKPTKNVDVILSVSESTVQVWAPSGISQVHVTLAAQQQLEMQYFYSEAQAYTKIEGVQADDMAKHNAAVTESEVMQHVTVSRGKVTIKAGDQPLDWQVRVIDFYR